MSTLLGVLVVVVTLIFFASTLDSMSYAISSSSMHAGAPPGFVRAFWCFGMGAAAIALLLVGDGGVQALQSFIVVTAVPVGLIMLPTLWTAPRLLRTMAVEQGIATASATPSVPRPAEDGTADEEAAARDRITVGNAG